LENPKNLDEIIPTDKKPTDKKPTESNENNMSDNNKRIALAMRLFVYKERLKYKCNVKQKKFYVINESYTSKICFIMYK
jgi:transposase